MIIKPVVSNREKDTSPSIKYNRGKDVYSVSFSGQRVAFIEATRDQYMDLLRGDRKRFIQTINEKLGMSEEDFEFSAYIPDSNITNIRTVKVEVCKNAAVNELPYGVFRIEEDSMEGLVFKPFNEPKSNTILVNNINLTPYLDQIKIKSIGRKSKKGLLLYGPPGNGKSSAIHSLRGECTEANRTRMFFVSNRIRFSELYSLRDFFKDDYNIFVIEEVTERVEKTGVADLLTFADGEDSWSNTLIIATTNYPEDLAPNIVDRPGRFDTFIEFKKPTNEDIIKVVQAFGITESADYLLNKQLSYDYVSFICDQAVKDNKSIIQVYDEQEAVRKRISQTFKGKGMGI